MLIITHVKNHRRSQTVEPLVERDKNLYAKKLLTEEGGAKEDSLQWMSFPDADKLGLLASRTRPRENSINSPWAEYHLTQDQFLRMTLSGMDLRAWLAEAATNGEFVERIWPPQENPPHMDNSSQDT